MPVLPLTDGDGVLRHDATFTMIGAMHFPQSPEKHMAFYAASWARLIPSRETKPSHLSLCPEAVKLIANAPPLEEFLSEMKPLFIRGYLVGQVLAYACCHALNDPASASRNKAQYLQRHNLEAFAEEHPSFPLAKSERSQNENWKEFSSVAHLWAGLILYSHTEDSGADHDEFQILGLRPDEIPRLLAYAEYFRNVGEGFEPAGQRPTKQSPSTTILDPEQTWKCPKDLEIPDLDLELVFDDNMSWLLDQYNYSKLYGLK